MAISKVDLASSVVHLSYQSLAQDHFVMASSERQRKALVIGAGPVGALTALCLHRRGWDVEIWESREGKSALSFLISVWSVQ
jgi:threonine dehydrogenase-like Zn-dependent dehydrogenase